MTGYNTEQKKMIVDFLSNHYDEPFTIAELIEGLKREAGGETVPGRSTVYRLIDKLVSEGEVKRFNTGHDRHFYYQIVTSHGCHEHIHMKCTSCGKLIHMGDDDTIKLLNEVLKTSHFKIDKEETTLFGLCDTCDEK